jgi:hypothetical protein
MPNAHKVFLTAIGLAALAACQKQPQPEQNIVIDTNAAMANADIEALPPDESSDTPSNELINGTDNPDVSDINSATNGD